MLQLDIRRALVTMTCALALLSPLLSAAEAGAAKPLVVIDPGHGGPYSNANANGLKEKNVNLAIGLELRRQLVARGYRVAMTRTTDRALTLSDIPTWNWSSRFDRWYFKPDRKGGKQPLPKDDLQARANKANRLGAALFISIHNNGSVNRSARGTETFASRRDPLGRSLSRLVHREIVRRTGLRDRRAQTADFYVCRWTNMPAILVEGAFITNPSDARLLKKSWFRRRIAVGIAEGVDTWFSRKPFKATARPVSTKYVTEAAASVSRLRFPDGGHTVVVASAAQWADAPGVAALAATLEVPLLWTGRSGPNKRTAAELARLAPDALVLVGTDGAFDEGASERLAVAASVETSAVAFLTAANRAALAVSIAESMTPMPLTQVLVIDEADTAAMLAAAPVAAAFRIPILLSRGSMLTEEAAAYLSDRSIARCMALLLGRSAALPASATSGFAATRRSTGHRVAELASWLNRRYYRAQSLAPVVVSYVNGAEYLSAASYAARYKRPVVPVKGRILPDASRLWITNRRPNIVGFEVFDGRKTLPAAMEHVLRKADYE